MDDRGPSAPARAIETLARRLIEMARQRDDVREALHELFRWLSEATRAAPGVPAAGAQSNSAAETPEGQPIDESRGFPAGPLVQKELRLGDLRVSMQVPAAPGTIIEPDHLNAAITGPTVVSEAPLRRRADFATIAHRCRLKAEACGWAALHAEALAARLLEPAELQAREELIRRARAVEGCWLWMLDAGWLPEDRALLSLCGENYSCLALAADFAHRFLVERPTEELMRLLAEAQSALRAVLLQVGLENDSDQLDMFWWLRDLGQAHRIYIDRHMRRDDPADPLAWEDRRARLMAWSDATDARRQTDRARTTLLKKVEYHVKRLLSAAAEDAPAHRQTILDSISEWLRTGFYPSDPLLARTLLPVYEQITEEAGDRDELAPVIRAVDSLAARQEAEHPGDDFEPRRRSDEILRAAALLRGRTVVLVGGEVRPLSKRRLERDLELKELRWLATSPHERLDALIPDIVRDDVDVVMLAIRLTSHSHGELGEVCAGADKPFVRLPGGYGSAQVAHQILEQVSERLALRPTPA